MASVPFIFTIQQTIEGALWLALRSENYASWTGSLANSFVFVALVVWPVCAPVSAALVERERIRLLAIVAIFALAVPLAYVGWMHISAQPYGVCIIENSLSYSNGVTYSPLASVLYVVCTCCPFLLSSHKSLKVFGAVLVAGLLVSASLYWLAFISVWCFFAAGGSLTIYLHFAHAHKKGAEVLPS